MSTEDVCPSIQPSFPGFWTRSMLMWSIISGWKAKCSLQHNHLQKLRVPAMLESIPHQQPSQHLPKRFRSRHEGSREALQDQRKGQWSRGHRRRRSCRHHRLHGHEVVTLLLLLLQHVQHQQLPHPHRQSHVHIMSSRRFGWHVGRGRGCISLLPSAGRFK